MPAIAPGKSSKVKAGKTFWLAAAIPQTELLAGTLIDVVAPMDGYVDGLNGIVQTAITTGGTVKVKINNVDVPNLVITFANSATKGTVQRDVNPDQNNARKFKAGDRISVYGTSFASAGAINAQIMCNSMYSAG